MGGVGDQHLPGQLPLGEKPSRDCHERTRSLRPQLRILLEEETHGEYLGQQ